MRIKRRRNLKVQPVMHSERCGVFFTGTIIFAEYSPLGMCYWVLGSLVSSRCYTCLGEDCTLSKESNSTNEQLLYRAVTSSCPIF